MHRQLTVALAMVLGLMSRPALADTWAVLKWIDGSCAIAPTFAPIDMEGVTVLGLYNAPKVGNDALLKLFKDKKCQTLRRF